jgi:UDP-N-acetylglucosamine 2-epimerase (non-hydrolysing)
MIRTKVLIVFGTRPEAIKMAPVVKAMKNHAHDVQVQVCVTGQHREMLDQVLGLFDINPDVDLDLMQPDQTPAQVAARVLSSMDPLLDDLRPDVILVQGDTTTVMAACIAAHYHRIRVGHVEAGLRTYDRFNPFPEEMNRVVTDHISDLHFAPTWTARDNLLKEGISPQGIFVTGNTVTDALQWMVGQPATPELNSFFESIGVRKNGRSSPQSLILVTAHRRESFGKPIRDICHALRTLAERDDVHILYPVHRNPNVWEPVHQLLGNQPNITLIPPVDYRILVRLMKCSHLILTDSGGIQEEAPSLGIPVLVLRETTERPEAVKVGAARVVGTNPERIVSQATRLLDDPEAYAAMARAINPYGDGRAAKRIVDVLLKGQCDEFSPGHSLSGVKPA